MPRPKQTQRREPKRAHVGFRVTPAMKRRLEAAAEESGRSLSQEVEARLERSFLSEDFKQPLAESLKELRETNQQILNELREERLRRRGYQVADVLGPELMKAALRGETVTLDMEKMPQEQKNAVETLLEELSRHEGVAGPDFQKLRDEIMEGREPGTQDTGPAAEADQSQQEEKRRPRQITIKGKRDSGPRQIKLGRRSTASDKKERSHGNS